ncbi:MAG: DMT family transporter [Desulfobacteraceae bacterium]|nr:DMT family transporter [Desulfobacteraceae bacterium]
MTGVALAVVLASAFFHAFWNYLAKKGERRLAFVWWALLVGIVLFLPVFLYFQPSSISHTGKYCILASALLHTLYFCLLVGAYDRGDLSLVYPLCRGSGPMLVPILAVLLIGEHLVTLGIVGIVLVVCGIYVVNLRSFCLSGILQPFRELSGGASLWALMTGAAIAVYSLVDKVGVGEVYPPVYIYLMMAANWIFLSAYTLPREWNHLMRELTLNWKSILAVGFLSNFTYLLILFAMQVSHVSYVVAVREVSIVFSALLGVVWLKESQAREKLIGSVIIVCGVVLIGFSR